MARPWCAARRWRCCAATVALALGLVFRRPLTQLLGRVHKLRWGEKEAELTGLVEAASDVQEAVKAAASPLPQDGTESEHARRERIERLMRDAATWGFNLSAVLGLRKMPEMRLQWSADQPVIVTDLLAPSEPEQPPVDMDVAFDDWLAGALAKFHDDNKRRRK
ncbi:hypothetical protein Airi01_090020 [Actinoallomurus iriomotensis]|uniref:Uncharacterized protein n=1 Tax=Actinoallomurus iriomotensis TaxID=478107 RepID=A0A9W6VUG1_9ACTN|nr:hypothetical protein Airi01_090020 [Actinoallomurus iriomotensis]